MRDFRELSEWLQRRCQRIYEAVIRCVPEKEMWKLQGQPRVRYTGGGLTLLVFTVYSPADGRQDMELLSVEQWDDHGFLFPVIKARLWGSDGRTTEFMIGVTVKDLTNFFVTSLGVEMPPMAAAMVAEMLKEVPPPPSLLDEEFDFST